MFVGYIVMKGKAIMLRHKDQFEIDTENNKVRLFVGEYGKTIVEESSTTLSIIDEEAERLKKEREEEQKRKEEEQRKKEEEERMKREQEEKDRLAEEERQRKIKEEEDRKKKE